MPDLTEFQESWKRNFDELWAWMQESKEWIQESKEWLQESRKQDAERAQAQAQAEAKRAQAQAQVEAKRAQEREEWAQAQAQAEAKRAQAEAKRTRERARVEAERAQAQAQAEAKRAQEREEWERERKESRRELDRQMKETDRRLGELGNRFGELAEHLVGPNIQEKFNLLGYDFDGILSDYRIKNPDGESVEVDIFLENAEHSIAVEVKAKAKEQDIDQHIKRLEFLRRYKDKHRDSRKLLGAIAGAIMPDSVRNYALKAGLYVIEQTGDTVKIDSPPEFIPREW